MSNLSNQNKSIKSKSQSLNRISGNDKNSKTSNLLNKEQSLNNLKLSSDASNILKQQGEQSLVQPTPKIVTIQSNQPSQALDTLSNKTSNLLQESKSEAHVRTNPRLNSELEDKQPTVRSVQTANSANSQYYLASKLEGDDDGSRYYGEMNTLYKGLVYKAPNGSRYQSDFIRHPIDPKSPKVNNNPWETFRIEQPIDFNTTSRLTYVNWHKPAPERNYIDLWKANEEKIPFAGKSAYKNEYLDWGKSKAAIEKPVAPKTVISEMPFIGKSSYRETYTVPENVTQVHKIDHNLFGKKSPLAPNVPMLTESMSHKTFKPFRVQPLVKERPTDDVHFQDAYPNQYRTTYESEFVNFNKKKEKVFTHKYKQTML